LKTQLLVLKAQPVVLKALLVVLNAKPAKKEKRRKLQPIFAAAGTRKRTSRNPFIVALEASSSQIFSDLRY